MNTVEQYLEDSARGNPEPICYTFQQFVYFHGREFKPCPDHKKYFRSYGGAGLCYRNSLKLVRKFPNDLTYAEGFAATSFQGEIRPHFGLHAWAVTREGEAVNPTWPDGVEYFGVVFDLNYVLKTAGVRKHFSVIDNYQDDFPLLSGIHVDWRAAWDMARPFREGFIPYPRRKGRPTEWGRGEVKNGMVSGAWRGIIPYRVLLIAGESGIWQNVSHIKGMYQQKEPKANGRWAARRE